MTGNRDNYQRGAHTVVDLKYQTESCEEEMNKIYSEGVNIPDDLIDTRHDGHTIRTGRAIVDRAKIIGSHVAQASASEEKLPNQYSGHTFRNRKVEFRLDGHKMLYHLDRVLEWENGKRVAPIHIDMGLTKYCNTACTYCIGVTQNMSKGAMIGEEALLRFIKDAGRLGVRSIAFIGDGEPTLNPAMYDAATTAKRVGIDIGIATNGLLLEMDRAHDLLRDTTFIRFNLSSAEPDNFQKVHRSHAKNFQPLIDKIRELAKIKKQYNYPCTIGLQMVLIPENYDQVIKLAKLGALIGVDYLQIKQCSDTEYREIGVDYADYETIQEELHAAESFSSDDYLVKVKWNKINISKDTEIYKDNYRKYDVCFGTPFLGQISGNGKVYPCGPFFGKDRFLMGDIHETSYFDIVQSDKYWQVQQDIMDNVDVHHDCTIGCRQDYINKWLWDLKTPPSHVNFI